MTLGPPPSLALFTEEKFRILIQSLRQHVAPILANNLLPHFTDHSVTHSDNLTEVIDKLAIGMRQHLSDKELMILYAACYLHDIGMQFERAGQTEIITKLNLNPPWENLDIPTKRELLRRYHNKISAELVQKSIGTASPPIGLQLTSEFEASYVARLCDAHCVAGDGQEYKELIEKGPNIRMGLLSALLRIADILDESRRRATREKARTLELDIESQTHWWRHHFTENVTFDSAKREIKIWFDFPVDRCDEYSKIVPQLQMPWVRAELDFHNHILLEAGCQWSLVHECRSQKYGDATEMPEPVLTAMLKQLHRTRQREDETRQTAKLIQFREAQPSIDRRIEELNSKKGKIEQADYICELSEIAKDMHELGGRRAAHATIYLVFRDGLQHLPTDKRLQIGLDLLRHAIESNNESCALELVDKLDPDFSALPADDVRKAALAKLRISAFDTGCVYEKSTAAIKDAMGWADSELRAWLSAELSRMKLLQGDFIEDGECNA